MTTKEKILIVALKLFAKSGFEAVSVSNISFELGITKGALYRHYKSKRDIFQSILLKMEENDTKRAKEFKVPEEEYSKMPQKYKNTSFVDLIYYTRKQFEYWTEDEFASNFRKMITLEKYRDKEMEKLYKNYLSTGVLSYLEDIFREINFGKIKDYKLLAIEFFSTFYMLIDIYDVTENKADVKNLFEKHLMLFCEKYI